MDIILINCKKNVSYMSYEVYAYGAYKFIMLFVTLCTARDDRSGLKHVHAVYWYVFNTVVCGGDS